VSCYVVLCHLTVHWTCQLLAGCCSAHVGRSVSTGVAACAAIAAAVVARVSNPTWHSQQVLTACCRHCAVNTVLLFVILAGHTLISVPVLPFHACMCCRQCCHRSVWGVNSQKRLACNLCKDPFLRLSSSSRRAIRWAQLWSRPSLYCCSTTSATGLRLCCSFVFRLLHMLGCCPTGRSAC